MKKRYNKVFTHTWKGIWEERIIGAQPGDLWLEWFTEGESVEQVVGSEVILAAKEVLDEQ